MSERDARYCGAGTNVSANGPDWGFRIGALL